MLNPILVNNYLSNNSIRNITAFINEIYVYSYNYIHFLFLIANTRNQKWHTYIYIYVYINLAIQNINMMYEDDGDRDGGS